MCEVPGCNHQPSFGRPGETATHCKPHKTDEVAKMPIHEVSSTAISDAAALSVAQYLQVGDLQEEFQSLTLEPTQYIDGTLCQMHNLGKCTTLANVLSGHLEHWFEARTRNPINLLKPEKLNHQTISFFFSLSTSF
jgi:hypothetical protein